MKKNLHNKEQMGFTHQNFLKPKNLGGFTHTLIKMWRSMVLINLETVKSYLYKIVNKTKPQLRKKTTTSSLVSGFTLVEMLIAIGIVSIIAAVVTFGYQDGANYYGVSNAAEEVETTLRQAQVDATSSRPSPPNSSDTSRFDRGYGVFFEEDSETYILYHGDKIDVGPEANRYDGGSEKVSEFNLPSRVKIESICVGGSEGEVLDDPCNTTATELHVHFRRPGFKAIISDHDENIWDAASLTFQSERDEEQEISLIILSSGRFNVVK